ncbi:MAG: protein-tyrosine-phosphatase, partial [Bacteroidota bacterium]|nr:protein-tyrosine-phosphatase [Bacteroidota bacterium]
MFSPIIDLINQIDNSYISDHRKDLLKPLHDYLALKIKQKKAINLNFICTHNTRRSQLSQVWAKVIADFYGININTFSGGIEITACNKRTIA